MADEDSVGLFYHSKTVVEMLEHVLCMLAERGHWETIASFLKDMDFTENLSISLRSLSNKWRETLRIQRRMPNKQTRR